MRQKWAGPIGGHWELGSDTSDRRRLLAFLVDTLCGQLNAHQTSGNSSELQCELGGPNTGHRRTRYRSHRRDLRTRPYIMSLGGMREQRWVLRIPIEPCGRVRRWACDEEGLSWLLTCLRFCAHIQAYSWVRAWHLPKTLACGLVTGAQGIRVPGCWVCWALTQPPVSSGSAGAAGPAWASGGLPVAARGLCSCSPSFLITPGREITCWTSLHFRVLPQKVFSKKSNGMKCWAVLFSLYYKV